MIFGDPAPFDEALAVAKRKHLLPTNLNSAQLSKLAAQLKQRSVFSARMDKAGVLQTLGDNVAQIVSEMPVATEDRYRSIPEAKAQLKQAMYTAGVPLADADHKGGLTDFYSDARRQLMVETNVLDTFGFGRHVASNDPVALDVNPGLELVRMIDSKVPRDWEQRWSDAMDAIGDAASDGCTDPDDSGRMVALVNHPIWQALGDGAGGYRDTLGNSWPPFAFNSGMSTIAVPRGDCVALGIIGEDDRVDPDDSFDLNEHLEASAAGFNRALQAELVAGGALQIVNGILRLVGNERRRRAESALAANINDLHDSLGRFAPKGDALSERDNIRRGRKAIERAIRTRRDVPRAMQVKGLGDVHFIWGRPGTPKPDENGVTFKDGYGISHIMAKRGEPAARMLPLVLAKGRVLPQGEFPNRRLVKWNNWTAVVQRSNANSSFVVTHIDDDVETKKMSRLPIGSNGSWTKIGTGLDFPCLTQRAPLRAGDALVASNANNLACARAGVKTLLRALQEAA